ncbi:uncharacterized protein TRIADDRAFT_53731 [Trichoplax adhaerens]|uniref:EGF-like domain-containing protein n=1 Tax=Trichoplax adhaerens TaxID=10228 RepID=B3RQ04_TRIAD|nr:predicted protein [Trichoplax adhaerens]EDV27733.1 predicted protein [Trichoplax adhaerens]|eukprot:XP_002109567.1 predicted protein [Trichoplax adhaerens]
MTRSQSSLTAAAEPSQIMLMSADETLTSSLISIHRFDYSTIASEFSSDIMTTATKGAVIQASSVTIETIASTTVVTTIPTTQPTPAATTRIPCNGQCHANATCQGSGGNERCECESSLGYYGDGITCTEFTDDLRIFYLLPQLENKCITNPNACGVKATCSNTSTSYFCQCKFGYYLSSTVGNHLTVKTDSSCLLGLTYNGEIGFKNAYGPSYTPISNSNVTQLFSILKDMIQQVLNTNSTTKGRYHAIDLTSIGKRDPNNLLLRYLLVMKNGSDYLQPDFLSKVLKEKIRDVGPLTAITFSFSDANECENSEINTCNSTISTCIDLVGKFVCECRANYYANNTNNGCIEPDLCRDFNNCRNGATCLTINRKVVCRCSFLFKGKQCQFLTEGGIVVLTACGGCIVLIALAISFVYYYKLATQPNSKARYENTGRRRSLLPNSDSPPSPQRPLSAQLGDENSAALSGSTVPLTTNESQPRHTGAYETVEMAQYSKQTIDL